VLELVCAAGPYPAATNAAREEEYFMPVAPGDVVLGATTVTEVTPEKRTWLGRGVFIGTTTEFLRENDGAVVGLGRNVLYVFDGDASSPRPAPRPGSIPEFDDVHHVLPTPCPRELYETRRWESVTEGETLPPVMLQLDFMDLVLAVQGTRHAVRTHIDGDFARGLGNRDAYFSTLWQSALLGRLATDWAGPEALVRSLTFRMADNICPGDSIVARGAVARKESSASRCVSVDVRIDTEERNDVTVGSMTVELL
jgi:acyl dehydratase